MDEEHGRVDQLASQWSAAAAASGLGAQLSTAPQGLPPPPSRPGFATQVLGGSGLSTTHLFRASSRRPGAPGGRAHAARASAQHRRAGPAGVPPGVPSGCPRLRLRTLYPGASGHGARTQRNAPTSSTPCSCRMATVTFCSPPSQRRCRHTARPSCGTSVRATSWIRGESSDRAMSCTKRAWVEDVGFLCG